MNNVVCVCVVILNSCTDWRAWLTLSTHQTNPRTRHRRPGPRHEHRREGNVLDRRHIRQHHRTHCEFSGIHNQSVWLSWVFFVVTTWPNWKEGVSHMESMSSGFLPLPSRPTTETGLLFPMQLHKLRPVFVIVYQTRLIWRKMKTYLPTCVKAHVNLYITAVFKYNYQIKLLLFSQSWSQSVILTYKIVGKAKATVLTIELGDYWSSKY